jgi:Ca2+/Na+ antiporter
VSKKNLFIAPGGTGAEELGGAIARQREEWRQFRATELSARLSQISDGEVVALAICERLGPQFHILDNAEALRASPLFSLPVHWHYFRLNQQASQSDAEKGGLSPATLNMIEAMNNRRFHWLGNVPIDALAEMRKRGENEKFRARLRKYADELGNVSDAELQSVVAELGRGLSAMLAEHEGEIQSIAQEYAQRHVQTAVGAWITLAASFLPFFPALTPVAGLTVGAKYFAEKASEILKVRQKRRSFMGMLAAAAKEQSD